MRYITANKLSYMYMYVKSFVDRMTGSVYTTNIY